MTVAVEIAGQTRSLEVRFGELKLVPLDAGQRAKVTARPAKTFDLGSGPGQAVTREICGGVVGLILDGRGRPLELPGSRETRLRKLLEWNRELAVYPT
jgi:hypothetical protein